MAEFLAKIRAELDYSKIDKQKDLTATHSAKIAAEIDPNSIQTTINPSKKVTINNVKAKISEVEAADGAASKLSSSIQAALDKSKKPIKINNLKGSLSELDIDPKSVNTIAQKIDAALAKRTFSITVDNIKWNGNNLGLGKKVSEALSQSLSLKDNTGVFDTQIARLQDKFDSLKLPTKNLQIGKDVSDSIDLAKTKLSQLRTAMEKIDATVDGPKKLKEAWQEYSEALQRANNLLSRATIDNKKYASSLQITNLDNRMEKWILQNTKASKVFGVQVEQLRKELLALGADVPISELQRLENEFTKIDLAAAAAGKKGKSFRDSFKNAFQSLTRYISVSQLVYQAVRAFKDMYEQVVKIDTAMTELIKVTNEADSTYERFLENAGSKAKDIGTTVSDYINSTADFSRLGYDFDESQDLATVANVYSVVGDDIESIDVATKSVISTMVAFGYEASNAMAIVDKFNHISNNFAISSGGIGEALTRSASSMAAANNTLDETIALITAANLYWLRSVETHFYRTHLNALIA